MAPWGLLPERKLSSHDFCSCAVKCIQGTGDNGSTPAVTGPAGSGLRPRSGKHRAVIRWAQRLRRWSKPAHLSYRVSEAIGLESRARRNKTAGVPAKVTAHTESTFLPQCSWSVAATLKPKDEAASMVQATQGPRRHGVRTDRMLQPELPLGSQRETQRPGISRLSLLRQVQRILAP